MRKTRIARMAGALLVGGLMLVATPAAAGAADGNDGGNGNGFDDGGISVCMAERRNLRDGSSGYCVMVLQWTLNELFDLGLDVDWDFGPLTEAAVYDFQARYGLAEDGVVGSNTWNQLYDCKRAHHYGWPY